MFSYARAIISRSAAAVAVVTLAAGCTIDKSSAPDVSAPSGFGLSLTASANPDTLPRDGQSTAQLRFAVRDFSGSAVQGQRLTLTTSTGTLSAADVTTDASGNAVVEFTAPVTTSGATAATVTATPVSSDRAVMSGSRDVRIALVGPSIPVPSFTWTPGSPGQFDNVTFDASATTLSGTGCLDSCSYSWDFGDGGSSSGRIATHRFSSGGTFTVRLAVANPTGETVATSRTVVVGAAAAITPNITLSPTDPKVNDTIYFDASGSTTPDGTAIVSYSWDFGNGTTATTRQATTAYSVARTYTVRLTIVDALGRTATTTRTVTVS